MLLILWVASYFVIQTLESRAFDDARKKNRYLGNITSSALALPLWNLDEKLMQEQLSSLKSDRSFCGARVMDTSERVFVSTEFPTSFSADESIERHDIMFANPASDTAAIERLGTVEICFNKSLIEQELRQSIIHYLYFMVTLMVLVLLACYGCVYSKTHHGASFHSDLIALD